MIYIAYRGRLGNNIFQYVLAMILSRKINQRIFTKPPNFPFKKEKGTNRTIYKKNILVDDNNFLDFLELENLQETNFILNGYFHNISLVSKYRENILEMFDIDYRAEEGIFLHYRLGDFNKYVIPREEYYTHCLDKILKTSNQKIYLSTDSPNHNRIVNLKKKYPIENVKTCPTNTIIYGSQFENKILSLGTFSWWIGFLGNQNNILCPNSNEFKSDLSKIFPFEGWKGISQKEYLKIT
jgi:hypothetical protein